MIASAAKTAEPIEVPWYCLAAESYYKCLLLLHLVYMDILLQYYKKAEKIFLKGPVFVSNGTKNIASGSDQTVMMLF